MCSQSVAKVLQIWHSSTVCAHSCSPFCTVPRLRQETCTRTWHEPPHPMNSLQGYRCKAQSHRMYFNYWTGACAKPRRGCFNFSCTTAHPLADLYLSLLWKRPAAAGTFWRRDVTAWQACTEATSTYLSGAWPERVIQVKIIDHKAIEIPVNIDRIAVFWN